MPSSTSNTAFASSAFGNNENQSNLQANGGLSGTQSTSNGTSQSNVPNVPSTAQSNDRFRSRGSTPASSQARSPVSELSSSNKQKTDLNKLMSRGGANGNSANNNNNHHQNRNSNYNNNQRRGWDNNRVNNYQNNNRNPFTNRNYNNNMNRRPGGYQNSYSNNNNFNRSGGFRRNDDRLSNNRSGFRHNNGPNNFNNNRMMRGNNNRKFTPVSNKKFDATLKTEFDFEKANQVFQQMVDKLEDLNISVNGSGEKSGTDDKDKNETAPTTTKTDLDKAADKVAEDANFYDKTKSFFDNISCEAIERTKVDQKRFDWKQERKINAETFGLKITYRRNDGSFRRPPFMNQNRRYNNNNNNINHNNKNNGNQQPRNPRTNSS